MLSNYEKICVKLAIYDRLSRKTNKTNKIYEKKAKEIARVFLETEHNPEEEHMVKSILERIRNNKNTIYDYDWYAKKVGLVMDEQVLEQYGETYTKQKEFRESLKVKTQSENITIQKDNKKELSTKIKTSKTGEQK